MNKTFQFWKALESKVSRWFVLLSLSIVLAGSAIALRSPMGGSIPVEADATKVLHFHGNTEDGPQGNGTANCTGVGTTDVTTCDGPFLTENATLSSSAAAHWDINSAAGGANNRTIYDTSWVWRPTGATTIGGTITIEWWADVNAAAISSGMQWRIKLSNQIGGPTSNATPPTLSAGEFYQAFHTATPTTAGVPQKLTATLVNVPLTNVTNGMVLTIEPRSSDTGAGAHIWYDSTGNCSAASTGPCDSTITVAVVTAPSPTPTPTATPTPTPGGTPTPTPTPTPAPTPPPPACIASNFADLFSSPRSPGTAIVVTSNANSGAGTLRQAILDSNATAALDMISFSGVTSIALTDALPAITEPVFIDGGTTPTVELNGLGTQDEGSGSIGLWVRAGSTTVRGMIINRFGEAGIRLDADGVDVDNSNTIVSNRIGTNAAGTAIRPNFNRGILIVGTTGHFIGDGTAGGRNLISGNWGRGIDINTGGSATISGNYIGTNAAGTGDLGNSIHGIQIANSCGNTIGGTTAGARNIISGNDGSGIHIVGDIGLPASYNAVLGNYIGVDAGGNTKLPNDGSGIFIQASQNTIGGPTAAARNVISGNAVNGVTISSSLATANTVSGNYIGVGADGTTAIQNSNDGVRVGNNASNNLIGGADTTPGSCNNSCNLIANNGSATSITARAGVYIEPTAGTGNQVRRNSIFSNGATAGLGVDLGTAGATTNDVGDTDAGANDLQNKPIVTYANDGGFISGTLSSTPSTAFVIEVFLNPSSDTSAGSEARTFVGSVNISTNASGTAGFAISTGMTFVVGQFVTATATRNSAPFDTSEISDALTVASAPATSASISGHVYGPAGQPLRNVIVTLTDSQGGSRVTFTGIFGQYQFDNVQTGQSYTLTATSKRYRFQNQTMLVTGNATNADFTGEE